MRHRTLFASGAVAALQLASAAPAAVIQSFDNGWYSVGGAHFPGVPESTAGTKAGGTQVRSFFAFDLAGADEAAGISITFYANNGLFLSDAGTETAALFDYLGGIDPLVDGTGGLGAYNDLGTGTQFGQHTIVAANLTPMPQFTVELAPAFVAQFNTLRVSADPRIALGAALQTLRPFNIDVSDEGFWYGGSALPAAYLTITPVDAAIPEPAAWAFMIVGFGLVGASLRRARRHTRVAFG